jgi:SPP1 gp7 family putative phage head morphogenesis protein
MATPTIDVYLRHQAYVEGYKNGKVKDNEATFAEVTAVILLLLSKLGYENLGELPRAKLGAFLAAVNDAVAKLLRKHVNVTMADLRKFMDADLSGNIKIAKTLGHGKAEVSDTGLWSSILNQPIAGTGDDPKTVLVTLLASVLGDISRVVRRAYAENWTEAQFRAAIVGSKANAFKDGTVLKLQRKFATAIETMVQHVSSAVIFKVSSLFFDRYQWVSVLDSHTTDICRDRNGHVYEFADGPRPPAHYRCRSTIVPVRQEEKVTTPTYYQWIQRQPVTVQNDVIGEARGIALRAGKLTGEDIPKFDGTRPLTLDQFADKFAQMVNGVE